MIDVQIRTIALLDDNNISCDQAADGVLGLGCLTIKLYRIYFVGSTGVYCEIKNVYSCIMYIHIDIYSFIFSWSFLWTSSGGCSHT